METVRSWTDRDLRRLDGIIVEGERRFKERQSRSEALVAEVRAVLGRGATSSWQIARPQMIWVSHGQGSEDTAGRFVDDFGAFARALRK
jgi:glutamate-1-semialdehyde 2,1-aminomutase